MDKEETKKAIEVMQAYVDGKKLMAGCGTDVRVPVWNWESGLSAYKVKPEPIVRYTAVVTLNNGSKMVSMATFDSADECIEAFKDEHEEGRFRLIRLVED